MKKVVAVVPAAGSGNRLGSKTAKPYVFLNDKPLLAYTLLSLQRCRKINEIVVVAEKSMIPLAERIVADYKINKIKAVVAGGSTRTESVRRGISVLDKDTDFVLIHDGARPFVSAKDIEACVDSAIKHKAAICAVPCVATIKSADANLNVNKTLDRRKLWEVQTPQVFSYKLILRAYGLLDSGKRDFFDDASLVELLPHKVRIVQGSRSNIKITTKEDLIIAKAIIENQKSKTKNQKFKL